MPREEPPSAVTAPCPDCREDTIHAVLTGRMGTRGEFSTLDATVQCTECNRTHQVVMKEANDIEIAAVVSARNGKSRRIKLSLPGDSDVAIEEGFIADEMTTKLTGIELRDGRRVTEAPVKEVATLWLKEYEEVLVGFAINLDHKTITKGIVSVPTEEFSIGDEYLFGRLRVTVHAIKTKERLLKRGSAEAGEIVRVFARPTHLGSSMAPRPDKRRREELRGESERSGRGLGGR